jgi:hypothetical protein
MDQCVEEVEAEPDGDDQSDDRFTHRRLLKLAQGERIDAHQRQNRETERHEYDVEHDSLLTGAVRSADRCKLSIANWVVGRKDLISFRPAAMSRPRFWRADVAEDQIPAKANGASGPSV